MALSDVSQRRAAVLRSFQRTVIVEGIREPQGSLTPARSKLVPAKTVGFFELPRIQTRSGGPSARRIFASEVGPA